ncbi:MAG: hypothetical protein GW760_02475 [Legionella sp.]|jgi:hypothetical protein|nr:hypothetical protein [Legionella sp.]
MIDFDDLEGYGRTIRPMTQQADFWRLLFIRSRRMLLLSTKLVESFETYAAWVNYLDQFMRVLALYQACVLIPRFVINVIYVARHLLEEVPDDMIVRCWEMAYDFGWIMNGVLAAFILVGALAPLAVYLPVLTSSYQLCVHTSRFLLEKYSGKAMDEKLAIRIGVSVCIIATGLVMLLGGLNPVLAFTAAVLAVTVTLLGKWLATNPTPLSHTLGRLSIFAFNSATNENEHGEPLVLHEKPC